MKSKRVPTDSASFVALLDREHADLHVLTQEAKAKKEREVKLQEMDLADLFRSLGDLGEPFVASEPGRSPVRIQWSVPDPGAALIALTGERETVWVVKVHTTPYQEEAVFKVISDAKGVSILLQSALFTSHDSQSSTPLVSEAHAVYWWKRSVDDLLDPVGKGREDLREYIDLLCRQAHRLARQILVERVVDLEARILEAIEAQKQEYTKLVGQIDELKRLQ